MTHRSRAIVCDARMCFAMTNATPRFCPCPFTVCRRQLHRLRGVHCPAQRGRRRCCRFGAAVPIASCTRPDPRVVQPRLTTVTASHLRRWPYHATPAMHLTAWVSTCRAPPRRLLLCSSLHSLPATTKAQVCPTRLAVPGEDEDEDAAEVPFRVDSEGCQGSWRSL